MSIVGDQKIMSLPNQEEVERHIKSLDDHELLRLVAIENSEYRPESLEIANRELRRRGLVAMNESQYLSQFPAERVGLDGFCEVCRSKTTDDSPGKTGTVNFVLGTRLIGCDGRCPACGSIEQTLWVQIVLPLIPLGRYKVIYFERDSFSSRYIGRKLQKTINRV